MKVLLSARPSEAAAAGVDAIEFLAPKSTLGFLLFDAMSEAKCDDPASSRVQFEEAIRFLGYSRQRERWVVLQGQGLLEFLTSSAIGGHDSEESTESLLLLEKHANRLRAARLPPQNLFLDWKLWNRQCCQVHFGLGTTKRTLGLR